MASADLIVFAVARRECFVSASVLGDDTATTRVLQPRGQGLQSGAKETYYRGKIDLLEDMVRVLGHCD